MHDERFNKIIDLIEFYQKYPCDNIVEIKMLLHLVLNCIKQLDTK